VYDALLGNYVRPLQGQSPYTINASITFTEPNLGTTISFSYNKFGRRIQAVGGRASDIYEEPRDQVDLGITQPLMKMFELKFTVKNLADKDRVLTRADEIYEQNTIGRTYSLSTTMTW
jgi:outer membrane receptor for ferrienterochelin and colicin